MEIYNRMLKTVVHPSQDPFSSCGLPKMLIKTPHRMPHEDGINYLLEQNITIYTADNFRTIIAKKSNEVTKSCVFYTQRLSISSSALVCIVSITLTRCIKWCTGNDYSTSVLSSAPCASQNPLKKSSHTSSAQLGAAAARFLYRAEQNIMQNTQIPQIRK